jgi:hypothetical protein
MRSVIFLLLTLGILVTRVCFAHDADGRANWIAEGPTKAPMAFIVADRAIANN